MSCYLMHFPLLFIIAILDASISVAAATTNNAAASVSTTQSFNFPFSLLQMYSIVSIIHLPYQVPVSFTYRINSSIKYQYSYSKQPMYSTPMVSLRSVTCDNNIIGPTIWSSVSKYTSALVFGIESPVHGAPDSFPDPWTRHELHGVSVACPIN